MNERDAFDVELDEEIPTLRVQTNTATHELAPIPADHSL
jgi:hypothetical protein